MQKKFIALAVAGLVSGAAFAQSNVTVYGVADAAFENVSVTSSVAGGSNVGNYNRVSSNSSLIGFKGTEALGNGLNAIFQVESAVALDTNTGLVGGRDTFVGLQSDKMGAVKLGLQTSPSRLLGAMVDLNAGATGPGANSSIIGKPLGVNANTGVTTAGVFDTRLANSISYTSPSFSGFSGAIAYSAGENKSSDGTASASKVHGRVYDLGAFYANGPVYVGLTYGNLDNGREGAFTTTTAASKSTLWRLAGTYTFNGGHKVAALYEQNRADAGTAGAITEVKQNIWGLGGKFMVSANGGLIAQYYKANDASISNGGSGNNTGATLYELGYEHSLSKRTMLKANFSQYNNRDAVAGGFNVGAVAGVTAGADSRAFQAGIRHSF